VLKIRGGKVDVKLRKAHAGEAKEEKMENKKPHILIFYVPN
jgi:hypothetical protein